jgi:hypothetical protein
LVAAWAQAQGLVALLQTERYREVQAMAMTPFEKGVQAGLQQGLHQGWRTAVQKLLESRSGPLSSGAQERLEDVGPERLEALTLELLNAQSLRGLRLED